MTYDEFVEAMTAQRMYTYPRPRQSGKTTITAELRKEANVSDIKKLKVERKRIDKEIKRRVAKLAEFGDEPSVGEVLVFEKTFKYNTYSSPSNSRSRIYTYAAVRTVIGWYITGRNTTHSLTWEELIDFIGDASTVKRSSSWDIIR